jgi:flagellin
MAFGDINRVNTNLQASSSRFSLNKVNERLADNQLKLSTGLRINKAEDDAAGFSIASKLSGRLAGLEQAERNVGDAKSTLDVAESGLNSIQDVLVEIKAKATQAATDSIGQSERDFIGSQIESLADEINEIAGQTTFQGTELLNGVADNTDTAGDGVSDDLALTFQVGENSGDTQEVNIAEISVNALFNGIKTDGATPPGTAINNGNGNATIAVTGAVGSGGELDILTADETAGDDTDIADADAYRGLIDQVDGAIDSLASTFNQIGIDQNSLSIKQENLSQSITANSAARSRIEDADFAKVQSESVKLQILQQTATSALAQANSSPQAVLGFLGG